MSKQANLKLRKQNPKPKPKPAQAPISNSIVNQGGGNQNMSGNILISSKSRLSNANQNFASAPTQKADSSLESLITQLDTELKKLPEDQAKRIHKRLEALLRETEDEEPDKEMLKITGEGLLKAAGDIAKIAPTVLTIATEVVRRIVGF